jgi:hypothetical protein
MKSLIAIHIAAEPQWWCCYWANARVNTKRGGDQKGHLRLGIRPKVWNPEGVGGTTVVGYVHLKGRCAHGSFHGPPTEVSLQIRTRMRLVGRPLRLGAACWRHDDSTAELFHRRAGPQPHN